MANPRQTEREANETTKETARKIAQEADGAAQRAAEAGAGAARAGADMFQRSAATAQYAFDSGSKLMSELVEQSIRRVARTFGVAGEDAQHATRQSARNTEAIVESGTIIAGGMQNISNELIEFARKRMERNLHFADMATGCRTPQEFLATQSNFVRDNLEDFVQSTRRIAEISKQMADEAARRISNTSVAPQQ
jgi:phasin family protein